MDTEYNLEDEFLDDVEIFEGVPDYTGSQANEDGAQEDDADVPVGLGFMARATNAIRDWRGALDWYKTHQTTSQIGFDPDGMCLKVCRTARNIPARYLSAREAQNATPNEFRVHKVSELRRGMVLYFADPNDSNRFDHIVTMIGRVRGVDVNSLDSILTETNSLKANELVIVRGSFYPESWGDSFQFGSTWLNGVEFDVPGRTSKIEKFNNGGPVYNLKLLKTAADNGRDHAGRVLNQIERQIKRLPDSPKLPRVREFKQEWRDTDKIDLALLDEAIGSRGGKGLLGKIRDEIKRLIATLPDE